jgi:hypothetical protein
LKLPVAYFRLKIVSLSVDALYLLIKLLEERVRDILADLLEVRVHLPLVFNSQLDFVLDFGSQLY